MTPWHARSFRAMGSSCRLVVPDERLLDVGVDLVVDLERRWSRFLADSEVSRMNDAAGTICVVSRPTFELVRRAEAARRATGGRFHPLLLDRLVALGYDRTWAELPADGPAVSAVTAPPTDEPIECFDESSAVRIPPGTRFDPGGLGKGLAADLVAEALRECGADRLQIELGGDVRVVGEHWSGGPWHVGVDDRGSGELGATVTIAEGAVATSSRRRRRWTRGGIEHHHLLDPSTGTSAVTDLVAVTTVAAELWWAEVLAKVAVIEGSERARVLLADHGVRGILVHADADAGAARRVGRHEVVGAAA